MELIDKVRQKLRYGLVTCWVLGRLRTLGVSIFRYHLLLESGPTSASDDATGTEDYSACFLTAEDMVKLDRIDGRRETVADLQRRLEEGKLCFALKKGDEVACFTWIDLRECNFTPCRFALGEEEAYLHDLHTLKAFRGKDLARALRRRLYKELVAMGRRRFYSISDSFNTSSLRFKQKLGAQIIRTCFYVRLFKLPAFEWTLNESAPAPSKTWATKAPSS